MRSLSGFSLGTSLEHYRCYNVYVTSTFATRVSDQVYFRHKYITMPTMSPESHVVEAAQRLTTALKGNIPADSETAVGLKVRRTFQPNSNSKSSGGSKAARTCDRPSNYQNASNTIGNCSSSKGGSTNSKSGCGNSHHNGTSSKGADNNYYCTA